MKNLVFAMCALLSVFAAQDPVKAPEIIDPPREFDEWTALTFRDEKARLDNLAIHWQQTPRNFIHIVIYAGKKSCVGESEARWSRVRDWLVRKRGIPSNKITWANGGYREEPTVTCWLWPPDIGKAPQPSGTLKQSDVKIMKGCKIFSEPKR